MKRRGTLIERPLRLAVLVAALALCLFGASCSSTHPYEPTTSRVDGQTVFVIYRSPCPKSASCAAQVVINKQPYEYSIAPPTEANRAGPLYAIGSDSEARTIPAIHSTTLPVLALRIGNDWYTAIPFDLYPLTATEGRELCTATINNVGSYCVTHLGFPVTSQ